MQHKHSEANASKTSNIFLEFCRNMTLSRLILLDMDAIHVNIFGANLDRPNTKAGGGANMLKAVRREIGK